MGAAIVLAIIASLIVASRFRRELWHYAGNHRRDNHPRGKSMRGSIYDSYGTGFGFTRLHVTRDGIGIPILILNRRHLERVLQWFEHYNKARPQRALRLRMPIARSDPVLTSGRVICSERLGGLLREYAREPLPVAA